MFRSVPALADRIPGLFRAEPTPPASDATGFGLRQTLLAVILSVVLAGCGGGGPRAEPTAIPADSVIPDQPTVVFPTFTPILPGPTLTPTPPAEPADTAVSTPVPEAREPRAPSAFLDLLALPQQDVQLRESPGGPLIVTIPANQTLSAVAQSPDGQWIAVYTEDGAKGWVNADSLNLYGDGTLLVATEVPERSLNLLDTAANRGFDTSESENPGMGVIAADGLRIRSEPSVETGRVLGNLGLGTEVFVTGRNEDGSWLQIYLLDLGLAIPETSAWVYAPYVTVDWNIEDLPVVE
ncbi:MAG: SH3 domain-containing protein [Caldilineaceae bacterium]|nr:SH3 domain-containing protein [Caldilineaceae bacterium]